MQTFTLSLKSSNVKVGPIPVSMSNSGTCPDACPFKSKGCYAGQGPLNWIWKALTRGSLKRNGKSYSFGINWKTFVKQVKALPQGVFWRHNQAGDLAGDNNKIDFSKLKELVKANIGKKGFTYTHKPMTKENVKAVEFANKNGFTINLSGNSLVHADELKSLGIAPVVAVLPSDFQGDKGETPKGNRFIVCPAQTKEGVTCSTCQLCSKQRNIIVAFKAHGMAKGAVNQIAKQ
jgi:hypothetical protein